MLSNFYNLKPFTNTTSALPERYTDILQTGTSRPQAEEPQSTYIEASSVVRISEEALNLQKTYGSTPAFLIKDAYVSAPHRLPPDPATPLEDMVYRRDGLRINSEANPPRWLDSTDIVNYDEWLKCEQMIDEHVDARIAIYTEGKAEKLPDHEIIQKIEDYNATLPDRFHHDTTVHFDLGAVYRKEQWAGVTDDELASSLNTRRRDSYEQLYTQVTSRSRFKTG